MPDVLTLFLTIVCGWFVQSMVFILGMHAFAAKKVSHFQFWLGCAITTVFAFAVRESGLFTFGVHTILLLLVVNVVGFLLCKLSLNITILSSIVLMIMIMLSELLNVGILALNFPMDQISDMLQSSERLKAISALPGNAVLLIIVLLSYSCRSKRDKVTSDAA